MEAGRLERHKEGERIKVKGKRVKLEGVWTRSCSSRSLNYATAIDAESGKYKQRAMELGMRKAENL